MMLQMAYFDRANQPVIMEFGPVLDLEDVVGGKVSALATRAVPRDYLDTAALERYTVADLIGFARRLDPGLTTATRDAGRRLEQVEDGCSPPSGSAAGRSPCYGSGSRAGRALRRVRRVTELRTRPMTAAEFGAFRSELIARYAADKAEAGSWAADRAGELAARQVDGLLPEARPRPHAAADRRDGGRRADRAMCGCSCARPTPAAARGSSISRSSRGSAARATGGRCSRRRSGRPPRTACRRSA